MGEAVHTRQTCFGCVYGILFCVETETPLVAVDEASVLMWAQRVTPQSAWQSSGSPAPCWSYCLKGLTSFSNASCPNL